MRGFRAGALLALSLVALYATPARAEGGEGEETSDPRRPPRIVPSDDSGPVIESSGPLDPALGFPRLPRTREPRGLPPDAERGPRVPVRAPRLEKEDPPSGGIVSSGPLPGTTDAEDAALRQRERDRMLLLAKQALAAAGSEPGSPASSAGPATPPASLGVIGQALGPGVAGTEGEVPRAAQGTAHGGEAPVERPSFSGPLPFVPLAPKVVDDGSAKQAEEAPAPSRATTTALTVSPPDEPAARSAEARADDRALQDAEKTLQKMDALIDRLEKGAPATPQELKEIERAVQDAGLPPELAKAIGAKLAAMSSLAPETGATERGNDESEIKDTTGRIVGKPASGASAGDEGSLAPPYRVPAAIPAPGGGNASVSGVAEGDSTVASSLVDIQEKAAAREKTDGARPGVRTTLLGKLTRLARAIGRALPGRKHRAGAKDGATVSLDGRFALPKSGWTDLFASSTDDDADDIALGAAVGGFLFAVLAGVGGAIARWARKRRAGRPT